MQWYLFDCVRITSIRVRVRNFFLLEVDLSKLNTIIQEDATSIPIIHGKWASHMTMMNNTPITFNILTLVRS